MEYNDSYLGMVLFIVSIFVLPQRVAHNIKFIQPHGTLLRGIKNPAVF